MPTDSIIRKSTDGYIDGHYTDLGVLQSDLSELRSKGASAVILAFASWWNMDGATKFGSIKRGEGLYDYTYVRFHDWQGSPPIQTYQNGERFIAGEKELTAGGTHLVGPICERYFAIGGIVRIVTDPEEVEGLQFSYEGLYRKDLATDSMALAQEFIANRPNPQQDTSEV